jgi:hypothetical protein
MQPESAMFAIAPIAAAQIGDLAYYIARMR